MPISQPKIWLKLLAAVACSVGVICIALMIIGHRFAEQTVFSEINAMASIQQECANARISDFQKRLMDATDPDYQSDLQQVIQDTIDERLGFVCIDDSTKSLFTSNQRASLEKSLKSYYAQVYWGQKSIPSNLTREDGGMKNGFVFGYSFKVYPGIVKLRYHSWSGFESGGGQTDVYVWKGSGFRLRGKPALWIY